jgi:hypothetical protein
LEKSDPIIRVQCYRESEKANEKAVRRIDIITCGIVIRPERGMEIAEQGPETGHEKVSSVVTKYVRKKLLAVVKSDPMTVGAMK